MVTPEKDLIRNLLPIKVPTQTRIIRHAKVMFPIREVEVENSGRGRNLTKEIHQGRPRAKLLLKKRNPSLKKQKVILRNP